MRESDLEDDLFAGGQGRSAEEVKAQAEAMAVLMLVGAGIIFLLGFVALFWFCTMQLIVKVAA